MNHPNNYPYYISIKKFAQKYNIEERILNYYIPEIIYENFYPAKFFKLELEKDGKIAVYYLRVDDAEEQRLRTIVENRITKYSYLKALYKNSSFKDKITDLLEVLNEILDEICGYIFHDELRGSLEKFLPDYINYLAYIIETKKIRDYYKDYAFQRIPENLRNVINSDPEKAIIEFNALKDSENIFIQITIARNLINFCQNYPEKVLELMQYFLSVKEKRNLRRPIAKENSLSCLISLMLKSNYADTAKRIIWNLMTDNDLIIRQTAFDRMERILQIDNEFGLQILDQIRSQEKNNDILKRAAIISSKMSL